ncbi:UNVERIFIED_CONTAM: hypothetical protein PYX00_005105 [Menopon gallinae]|uniref:GTPase Era, mitochondrial n=1 Tax=Menopon gallinae TaxID=328185 RepID=A0AAW2HQ16_9NEOP
MYINRSLLLLISNRGIKCNHKISVFSSTWIAPKEQEIKKSVTVALIGNANSGKSTLINAMTGFQICAASLKPHTTRDYQRVFHVRDDTQIILLDTPGIISPRGKEKLKLKDIQDVSDIFPVKKAEVMGILVDAACKYTANEIGSNVMSFLRSLPQTTKFVLLLNKVDLLKDKSKLLKIVKKLTSKPISDNQAEKMNFSRIFMISALHNDGVDSFIEYLCSIAERKSFVKPVNRLSDHSDQKIVEQRVKAGLLQYFNDEVPYVCSCKLEYMQENSLGVKQIVILIMCPTERYKRIINGKPEILNKIQEECEADMSQLFGRGVNLRMEAVLEGKQSK